MSFPYVTDALNAVFGIHWHLPIPTFGVIVAIAVVLATYVAIRVVRNYEDLGRLPPRSNAIVSEMAIVSTLAGIVGARVFDILDNADRFLADPFSMICQIAGDGDWGIAANMALKPNWLPERFWAQTYDGNIAGVIIPPPGVYPAPIYEIAMALAIALVLWLLRFHKHRTGCLFSVFLLFAGFERILIEKIRVNVRYDILGAYVTQAEAISLLLIIAGLAGILATLRTHRFWTKIIVSVGVLSALAACAPR
jgi:phosphatidylglycerol---prolipoprotein diacylglyceryl transferase